LRPPTTTLTQTTTRRNLSIIVNLRTQEPRHESLHNHSLDLVYLLGHHNWILLGYLLPCHLLIVKGALVGVGVAVRGAEGAPATAEEAGQPDLLAASQTPVAGWLWGLLLCLLLSHNFSGSSGRRIISLCLQWCCGRRC